MKQHTLGGPWKLRRDGHWHKGRFELKCLDAFPHFQAWMLFWKSAPKVHNADGHFITFDVQSKYYRGLHPSEFGPVADSLLLQLFKDAGEALGI